MFQGLAGEGGKGDARKAAMDFRCQGGKRQGRCRKVASVAMPVGARLARESDDSVNLTNQVIVLRGQARLQQESLTPNKKETRRSLSLPTTQLYLAW